MWFPGQREIYIISICYNNTFKAAVSCVAESKARCWDLDPHLIEASDIPGRTSKELTSLWKWSIALAASCTLLAETDLWRIWLKHRGNSLSRKRATTGSTRSWNQALTVSRDITAGGLLSLAGLVLTLSTWIRRAYFTWFSFQGWWNSLVFIYFYLMF